MAQWVNNPPAMQETQRCRFDPWVGKIPWRRAWQPTLVFLPGESHEQRSLVGYSPWVHKELDMIEVTEHCSVPKLYLTLCDPMDHSTSGSLVLHYLLKFAQIHVH